MLQSSADPHQTLRNPTEYGLHASILVQSYLSPGKEPLRALYILCSSHFTMSSLPIVIIGAGVSGLTLAQYLRKSNVPFQIFERDASISARNGGWGLTLHWGLAALRQLLPEDILSRLNETCVNKEAVSNGDTGRYQFLDLCSGSALCDVPAAERIRVSRTRLRRLLADGVDVQVYVLFIFPSG